MANYHLTPNNEVKKCEATSPDRCFYKNAVHGSVKDLYAEIERKSARELRTFETGFNEVNSFHNSEEEIEAIAFDVLEDLEMNGCNSEVYIYGEGDLSITFEDKNFLGYTLSILVHKDDLEQAETRDEARAIIEAMYVNRFGDDSNAPYDYAEEQFELSTQGIRLSIGDFLGYISHAIEATNNHIKKMNEIREKYDSLEGRHPLKEFFGGQDEMNYISLKDFQ